jgi:hypothetical protein
LVPRARPDRRRQDAAEGEAQLRAPDRESLTAWLPVHQMHLARPHEPQPVAPPEPHRIREHDEDLLGVRPVTRFLPPDGRVGGYDKVGSALPLSAAGAADISSWRMSSRNSVSVPVETDAHAAATAASLNFHSTRSEPSCHGRGSEQSKGHSRACPTAPKISFNTDNTSGPLKGLPLASAWLSPPAHECL